jgi:hypothetical protein
MQHPISTDLMAGLSHSQKRHLTLTALALAVMLVPASHALELPKLSFSHFIARIEAPEIKESSGIVASERHEGIFWTHNDSGGKPRIFAIRRDGTLVATYTIKGADARDWEDIALGPKGHLYIGDIGNNNGKRRDLTIYKVPEPTSLAPKGVLKVTDRIPLNFPEGNFNCEALMVTPEAQLMVISKSLTATKLYAYDNHTWKAVQTLPIPNFVTGADMNKHGEFVVSTYIGYHIFAPQREGKFAEKQSVFAPLEQCEAVCWNKDRVLLTSEQGGIFEFDPTKHETEQLATTPPSWDLFRNQYQRNLSR